MNTKNSAPVTPNDFRKWKGEGRKITMLTVYDYPIGRLLDEAGVDCLLVGDSMGMVVQGWDTTLRVTLDQAVYHAEMVARAAKRALVVGDLPFLAYQASIEQAMMAAGRFLKETQCGAVKLEGGRRSAATIRALVDAGIPVMAHIGLTPQSVRAFGGFKVQRDSAALLEDAKAVADAGAFSIVLECIPAPLAEEITKAVEIPTIGIGAGAACDGQVLVLHDFLGLSSEFQPRFARRYAEIGQAITRAAKEYVDDVRQGRFPSPAESFK